MTPDPKAARAQALQAGRKLRQIRDGMIIAALFLIVFATLMHMHVITGPSWVKVVSTYLSAAVVILAEGVLCRIPNQPK